MTERTPRDSRAHRGYQDFRDARNDLDDAMRGLADAIVGARYASSSVMQGAAEVVAYGTAVKFL